MRNLTIKRTKSFVACISKMKIYIEDPIAGELTINNTPCRKIGELKNGEEKTFQIGEQSAKVYVIADKLSKNYCNEYYQIPEGQDDIFLSGQNKYNPVNGNAFRFDNNESADVVANRKRGTRKGLIILIIAGLLGGFVGYSATSGLFFDKTPEIKTFSSYGMTLTLTDEFKEVDIDNYTAAYESRDLAVFVLKEPFSLADGFEDNTLEEYAGLVILASDLGDTEIKNIQGLVCFDYEYTNPETNDTYFYYSYVYKTTDAFWTIQFVTLSENAETYEDQISEWAKDVKFAD